MSQDNRQSPIIALRSPEPEPGQDVAAFVAAIKQRSRGRKSAVRPTEKRRRDRQMTIAFSSPAVPDRLRTLAGQWGLLANNGSAAVSELVELLLLPQLEAAERGQIMLDDLRKEEPASLPLPPPVGEQWL
mgnify:CR=1 FL=1